jgi:hypothetical protein
LGDVDAIGRNFPARRGAGAGVEDERPQRLRHGHGDFGGLYRT